MWQKIIGHTRIVSELQRDIESGTVHHAYLFAGPRSVGMSFVARIFATHLQTGDCSTETVFDQIAKGSHPDVITLTATEPTIKIETIREVIDKMHVTFQSPYHICIIDEIARMTHGAANAFLKLLEDPPARTVFIMTTSRPNAVLQTILSRVKLVRFSDVAPEMLHEYIDSLAPEMPHAKRDQLIALSDMRPGRLIQFLQDPKFLERFEKIYEETRTILESCDTVFRFHFAEKLSQSDDSTDLEMFFQALMHLIREGMHMNVTRAKELPEIFSRIDHYRYIITQTNANKRLVLENLMLVL